MYLEEISKKRNLLSIAVCVAVVQVAFYYLVASMIRSDGSLAIAQPDTLLYCQAARRIAEGFPFSFSSGTAVSTGTTSVLYPFLLAFFYWMGFKGSTFLAAGFALNAVFYLLFVVGWGLIACRVFEAGIRSVARIISVALIVLFGPFAYCALAQSDIGLWMAVSAWIAYGLFSGTKWVYVPLLFVAPWVRPEGMVVVVAFCALCALDALRRRRIGIDALVSAVSVASVIGVFTLNYALTGECQFSSVAYKGYFKNLSFTSAVYMSAIDFMQIVKAYLLGIPQNAPRDFFYIPVVGAAFMWIGIFARPKREVSWRELAWYLAMFGGVLTVAASGWQNTNLDRYLVWTMPILLLYMAFGADVVSLRLQQGVSRILPGMVLIAFTGVMGVVLVFVFGSSSTASDHVRTFAARCDAVMPKGASFGIWGNCGVAYDMLERHVAHLSGIYSPEFFTSPSISSKFETLKNEPETRFDYWFSYASDKSSHYCDKPEIVAGPEVLVAPPDFELRKADWSAYDAAAAVPSDPAKGTSLRARVDVAYDRDEKTSGYESLSRDDYPLFAPFHRVGSLGGTNIVEAGRFLLGGDAMTVTLEPGRDVHVVMRTALKCKVSVEREIGHRTSEFSMKSPMKLQVFVDDTDAGMVEFSVEEGDFCDAHFTIPGKFITSSKPRLTFLGEHVAFAYWFYQ